MRRVIIAAWLLVACGPRTDRTAPMSPLADEAVAGVTAPALRALLADHWEATMRAAPTWATRLGDHRFDDQLPRRDPATIAAHRAERRAFLDRARAIDPATLDERDRVTLALFEGELAAQVATEVCEAHQWSVSTGTNPLQELADVVDLHPRRTPEDGANLAARLRQGARLVDDTIANLEAGLAAGRVAAAEAVRRTIAQLDGELARPVGEWALMKPGDAVPGLRAIVEDELKPALTRYRDLLRDKVLPAARGDGFEGVGALPDGEACYRAAILEHLGLARAPEMLHELGLAEIARIDRELAELGAEVLGTTDLASTIERLRTDRSLYFETGDGLVTAAERALARARAEMPDWFGILPRADCVVRVIPAHEAPYTTIAYYRQPNPDGSKPGEYFVNTYRPEVRPRFELEALSWHEAIPGHHLQIAIAQELGAVPAFRKHGGSTAYVEGWALYTERLADEMDLYTSDLDRIGMLSYDAWRASRLVVDTGLHAMGWTRAQAEAFMLAHTALTPENISNEVDRYISWPGQALAYKVGQLEILALRQQAQGALGDRFDIKRFHDVVLGQGAVTLPVLRAQVEAWIAEAQGQ